MDLDRNRQKQAVTIMKEIYTFITVMRDFVYSVIKTYLTFFGEKVNLIITICLPIVVKSMKTRSETAWFCI